MAQHILTFIICLTGIALLGYIYPSVDALLTLGLAWYGLWKITE